jgi:hypothetical protein
MVSRGRCARIAETAKPFARAGALVGAMLGSVAIAAAADVTWLHRVPRSALRVTANGGAPARGAYEPCEVVENDETETCRRADTAVRRAYTEVFGGVPSCGVTRAALVSRSLEGRDEVVAALSCSTDEGGWLAGLVVLSGPPGGSLRITQIVRGAQLVPTRACGGVVRLAKLGPWSPTSDAAEVLPWTTAATVSSHRLVVTAVRPDAPNAMAAATMTD